MCADSRGSRPLQPSRAPSPSFDACIALPTATGSTTWRLEPCLPGSYSLVPSHCVDLVWGMTSSQQAHFVCDVACAVLRSATPAHAPTLRPRAVTPQLPFIGGKRLC